ncbi:nuclear transport factor 2 family protein [Paramicrobacterium sp. CJ85]|uniref:nuclear transport factor 2 family protein n=1 Tax=Paramicrobacterium sp. CJ85 TaxID=3445355 RepID=UPI003F605276
MTRTPTEVIHDHLIKRLEGELEADIAHNFDESILILSGFGTFRGHDGIRQSAALLAEAVKTGDFAYNRTVVEREYGFLEWTATGEDEIVRDGADSFHVVDGLIVAQTIHYTVWPRD